MTIFTGRRRRSAGRTGWLAWLAVLALVAAAPAASAQTHTETGLEGGEHYYFLDLTDTTGPQTIEEAIVLETFGDDSGDLESTYYSTTGVISPDDLTNEYSIDVTATGGVPAADSANPEADVYATGVSVDGNVTNSGALTVTARGGGADAGATGESATAWSTAEATGFEVYGDLTNSEDVNITATAGDSTATSDDSAAANAYAKAKGIDADSNVENSGTVTVTATAGNATASGDGDADVNTGADAMGIYVDDGNVENSGSVTVTATAGTAEASSESSSSEASADATAWGIAAYGGGDAYADSDDAYGNVDNTGSLDVSASAGASSADGDSADATSTAFAQGIEFYGYGEVGGYDTTGGIGASDAFGTVTNSGDIAVSAQGNTADATGESDASADGSAGATGIGPYFSMSYGGYHYYSAEGDSDLYGADIYGDVSNSGDITVGAASGAATAVAEGYAEAYTRATATGILTNAWVESSSDGQFVDEAADSVGNITNSGAVTVTAASADARAEATGGAEACSTTDAQGIMATGYANDSGTYEFETVGTVTNSGDITVSATSGDATALSGQDAYAYAVARAGGIDTDYYDPETYYRETYTPSQGSVAAADGETIGAIHNTGAVVVTARGGDSTAAITLPAGADSEFYGAANSSAQAWGLYTWGVSTSAQTEVEGAVDNTDSIADVVNDGDVTVTATAGNATISATAPEGASGSVSASAGAWASGIHTKAGDADSGEYAYSDVYGDDSFANVANTGAVTVTAAAGTASAAGPGGSEAYAGAEAYGISTDAFVYSGAIEDEAYADTGTDGAGNVTNSGAVAVAAAGADARAEATADSGDSLAYSLTIARGITATGYTDDADTYEFETVGTVTNSGDITVSAASGDAAALANQEAEAYASANAVAIKADGRGYSDLSGNDVFGSVVNSGAVTAAAAAGAASAAGPGASEADADARAYGIDASAYIINAPEDDGAVDLGTIRAGAVTNTGPVTVAAVGGSADAASDGDARAYADAIAYGIRADSGLANGGNVIVTATAGEALASGGRAQNISAAASATGVRSYGHLANSGDIAVTTVAGSAVADGDTRASAYAFADAWGIVSLKNWGTDSKTNALVENSGDITVAAIGGAASAALQAVPAEEGWYDGWASAYAVGISAFADGTNTVINSGNITATAIGGSATVRLPDEAGTPEAAAADAFTPSDCAAGISIGGGEVQNSGDITAAVTAGAYDTGRETDGAYAFGIDYYSDGALTNTGTIRAFGDNAYEVGVAEGTVTLVDRYNMTLDADPAVGSLWAYSGAGYDLNDAELTVSFVDDETRWETEYAIFETADGDAVTGAFSGLGDSPHPSVIVSYLDRGTAGSADDAVMVSFDPYGGGSALAEGAAIMQQTARMALGLVQQRQALGFLGGLMADAGYDGLLLFADAGTTVSDAAGGYIGSDPQNGFYLTPYRAEIRKRDARPVGWDADVAGFVLGYDRRAGDNLLGAFLGYSRTDIGYNGLLWDEDEERQEQFTLGVSAMMPLGNWTLRGQLAAFFGSHEYQGLTGIDTNAPENADYDSSGFGATVMGGYPLEKGRHLFLPELGVEMLYTRLDDIATRAPGASSWEIESASESSTNVSTVLNFQWLTQMKLGGVTVMPSVAVGMRHLLTDEVLELTQSIGGSSPFTVASGINKTSGTGSASLRLGKDALTAEIGYAGEVGDESKVNNLWLQVRYNF